MYQTEYLLIAISTLGLLLRTRAAHFREAYQRVSAKEGAMRILRASEVQARREAEENARVKSRFLAHVSHEVRTPLNAISGTAQMLQQTPLTPEQQEYVDVLATGSETLEAILSDILDFARIEAGKVQLNPEPLQLEDALQQAIKLVQPQLAGRDLCLTTDIGPDVPATITTDPIRLRQVLLNLLTNAAKFTTSGTITIAVSRLITPDGNMLQIAVSDTGSGIPAHEQASLFEPFVQGASENCTKQRGSGLGLAISKELVTLMGGEIWLDSNASQGATFTFTLPLDA